MVIQSRVWTLGLNPDKLKLLRVSPNNQKKIALLGALTLFIAIGAAAYKISYDKGKIKDVDFTISQSLAFGHKPTLATMFLLAMLLMINTVAHDRLSAKSFRIFLVTALFALFITIIWITTYRDALAHYSIAFVMFSICVIYNLTVRHISSGFLQFVLTGTSVFSVLTLISLATTNRLAMIRETKAAKIAFASLENAMLVNSTIALIAPVFLVT